MENLSRPRVLLLIGLGALGAALMVVLFVVYAAGSAVEPVELTAALPDDRVGDAGEAPPTTEGQAAAPGVSDSTAADNSDSTLRVYIAGAVRYPDVYNLKPGERLVDALEAAGGPTAVADLEAVNLARRVRDEDYYYIPVKIEAQAADGAAESVAEVTATPRIPPLATNRLTEESDPGDPASLDQLDTEEGPVNLNTASRSALESLPGIGPARARAIIVYREENGQFRAIDEITAVPGIGSGILENLQHLITVGP